MSSDPTDPHDHRQAGDDDEKRSRSLKADLTLQGTITLPPQAQPTANSRQAEPNNNRRDPILHHYSTVGMLAFTAMLVIVGSFQTCILFRQATIMNKQARIASTANNQNAIVNRAFVYFDKLDVSFSPAQNDWDFDAMAVWGNSGNTPTTHLYQAVGCFTHKEVLTEPFDAVPWPKEASPGVYGPKTTVNFGGSCHVPATTIRQVDARNVHFYICGIVKYGDTIDRSASHRTEFCYEITGIDRNRNRFTGITVGRHNCADEECPQ